MRALLRALRTMAGLVASIPLEAAIAVLAIVLIAGGLAIQFGAGVSMLGTGAVLLFLEFWPSIAAARKR